MTIIDLPLADQAQALSRREVSAVELAEETLRRISERDPVTRAVVSLDREAALAIARDQDMMRDAAPLAGMWIGVKDIIDVAGTPTRCGSFAHDDHVRDHDAAAVARLRLAGFNPSAKLATYEYALTGPAYDQPNPPARNPWNPAHITGGSSSGSAAAVAGGLFRAALGTDTGGSIRSPAGYSGIVGLKPTRGRVPDQGVFPLSRSLDCVGPMAATVADAAYVMDILSPEAGCYAALGGTAKGMTVGYARSWFASDPACDPAILEALDDAAGVLSRIGAKVELIDLPAYQPLEDAGAVIMQAEALDVHARGLAERIDRYGVDARRNLLTGVVLTSADVKAAWAVSHRFAAVIDAILARCDVILAPTTLAPAPAFADFADGAVWTAMRTLPFNMTGHPAISVPCGMTRGLPIGLQFVGRTNDEATLCRIAQAFEQNTDFAARSAFPAAPVMMQA